MSKHTPGPWRVEGETIVEGMGAVCIMSPPDVREEGEIIVAAVLDISTEVWPKAGRTDANARLISAAPDLLAACERAKEILDAWGPERRGHSLELLHERLSKAIAKATAVHPQGERERGR